MRRQFHLLQYALQALLRHRGKSLSLLIIYAAVVAFFSSVLLLTTALRHDVRTILDDTPDLWVQKLAGGRLDPVSRALADSLVTMRGVEKVITRIWGYYYDSPTGAVFTVLGSDSNFNDLDFLNLHSGAALSDSSVICGSGFLELHYAEPGQTITLFDHQGELRNFEISGTFDSASDLLTRDLLVFSMEAARSILGLDRDKCTDIALVVTNPDEIETVATKISRRFYGMRVVTRDQLQLTYEALFGWRGGLFIFGGLLSLLAFLILAWDRASGLSREERKELGILKGIGWHITDVLWMKFWEGSAIAVTATLAGILIGYVHVFVLNAWLLKPYLIGWSVLYPDFSLRPVIDPGNVLLIFFLSVVPYLTATVIPAWKGAITDPAEVMQYN